MPQGGRPKRNGNCKHCGGPFYEIWWRDGYGFVELLESHCNQCGYAEDGEGNVRYLPSNEALLQTVEQNRRSKEY